MASALIEQASGRYAPRALFHSWSVAGGTVSAQTFADEIAERWERGAERMVEQLADAVEPLRWPGRLVEGGTARARRPGEMGSRGFGELDAADFGGLAGGESDRSARARRSQRSSPLTDWLAARAPELREDVSPTAPRGRSPDGPIGDQSSAARSRRSSRADAWPTSRTGGERREAGGGDEETRPRGSGSSLADPARSPRAPRAEGRAPGGSPGAVRRERGDLFERTDGSLARQSPGPADALREGGFARAAVPPLPRASASSPVEPPGESDVAAKLRREQQLKDALREWEESGF
jgi:hypothetical protein